MVTDHQNLQLFLLRLEQFRGRRAISRFFFLIFYVVIFFIGFVSLFTQLASVSMPQTMTPETKSEYIQETLVAVGYAGINYAKSVVLIYFVIKSISFFILTATACMISTSADKLLSDIMNKEFTVQELQELQDILTYAHDNYIIEDINEIQFKIQKQIAYQNNI